MPWRRIRKNLDDWRCLVRNEHPWPNNSMRHLFPLGFDDALLSNILRTDRANPPEYLLSSPHLQVIKNKRINNKGQISLSYLRNTKLTKKHGVRLSNQCISAFFCRSFSLIDWLIPNVWSSLAITLISN